jgi:pyruvate kinase
MRTKIIATIGPSSDSYETIHEMVEAGLDIARMNFSHCTTEEYIERKERIEKAAAGLDRKVALLLDLQGPRIRVGELGKEGRVLREGDTAIFSTKPSTDPKVIFVDYPLLHSDIKAGDPLFLVNGEIELEVSKIEDCLIYAEVLRGGTLYSRKAVNVPRTKLTASGLTQKDIEDVKFGLSQDVEFIAISFVQTAEDVQKLRELVGTKAKIVAKIETALAVENVDAIIQASDAIMIARGDLGVEIPGEQLPFIQKNLIRHAAWYGKASITATQMLTSMVNHPHPTRAEVSDIANAVWDGTDAVMLSDETASGQFPLDALKTMVKVVRQAEESRFNRPNQLEPTEGLPASATA